MMLKPEETSSKAMIKPSKIMLSKSKLTESTSVERETDVVEKEVTNVKDGNESQSDLSSRISLKSVLERISEADLTTSKALLRRRTSLSLQSELEKEQKLEDKKTLQPENIVFGEEKPAKPDYGLLYSKPPAEMPPVTWTRIFIWIIALSSTMVYQFLGLTICFYIMEKGISDIVPKPIFFAPLLNALVWIHYAIRSHNRFGFLSWSLAIYFNTCYSIFYYTYSNDKQTLKALFTIIIVYAATAVIFTKRWVSADDRTDASGCFALYTSTMLHVFPLIQIKHIMDSGHSDEFSYLIPRTIGGFVVHLMYGLYGFSLPDYFVQIGNAMGLVVVGSQLAFYFAYSELSLF